MGGLQSSSRAFSCLIKQKERKMEFVFIIEIGEIICYDRIKMDMLKPVNYCAFALKLKKVQRILRKWTEVWCFTFEVLEEGFQVDGIYMVYALVL